MKIEWPQPFFSVIFWDVLNNPSPCLGLVWPDESGRLHINSECYQVEPEQQNKQLCFKLNFYILILISYYHDISLHIDSECCPVLPSSVNHISFLMPYFSYLSIDVFLRWGRWMSCVNSECSPGSVNNISFFLF